MKEEKQIIDTIAKAMKEMTSKETTHAALKELIGRYVNKALEAAIKKLENSDSTVHFNNGRKRQFVRENILSAYPENNII